MTPAGPPLPETARCIQDALEGGAGSGMVGGAGRGDIGAGLQIDDTGVAELLLMLSPPRFEFEEDDEEEDDEDELALDTAGGLNWPLLSDPGLSRDGEDFFFAGRILALPPPPLLLLLLVCCCCCCLHFALRFLNHTWAGGEPHVDDEVLCKVTFPNPDVNYLPVMTWKTVHSRRKG